MAVSALSPLGPYRRPAGLAVGLVAFFTFAAAGGQPAAQVKVLRIGTSGTLAQETQADKEEAALDTLKSFIKSETGFDNEIVRQKDWRELAEKLAGGQLHLAVFQGHEFAWAQARHAKLRPLALAVNVHTYRTAHIVTRKDNKAADFEGLKGQSFVLPRVAQAHLQLFAERQTQARGATPEKYFSKITTPDNLEDAVDDVVDGKVQAAVVDRVGLEAYKRRKPGRFDRLKEVARSPALPPPVVAYQAGVLDEATLKRFREGLLNAKKKEKGERLLTLFRLTGFEPVPGDFDRVLAETRKAFPPPGEGK